MSELFAPGINLDTLKNQYGSTTFVETGCWTGDALHYARQLGFTKLYSCDINLNCVNNCLERVPGAIIHNTDSLTFLENILPTITERTAFWLDAHFPGHYGLPDSDRTLFPLAEELQLIKSLKQSYEHDIIIFDDVRVLAAENNPTHDPHLPNYYKINKTVAELTSIFSDTHDYSIVQVKEGVLVMVPKK
jgi:hypothetical protein